MPMKVNMKNNVMLPHSEEKVAVYGAYLTRYLAVLTNQNSFKNIIVVDLFAGTGISANKKEGSAVVAAKVVQKYRNNKNNINVHFLLNEMNPTIFAELENNLQGYGFPQIHNLSADDFVAEFYQVYTKAKHHHACRCLFFIDPFGYTQLSQNKLGQLLADDSIEIMMFIPTTFICRFLDAAKINNTCKPVLDFLRACGIDPQMIKGAKSVDNLKNILMDNFKERGNTEYVYAYTLINKQAINSKYNLFFITHNDVGADKFIDAMHKIKTGINTQQPLFEFDDEDSMRLIKLDEYLTEWRDNCCLDEYRIKIGLRRTVVRTHLAGMETEGKLDITSADGESTRRKGSFYLGENTRVFVKIKKP